MTIRKYQKKESYSTPMAYILEASVKYPVNNEYNVNGSKDSGAWGKEAPPEVEQNDLWGSRDQNLWSGEEE